MNSDLLQGEKFIYIYIYNFTFCLISLFLLVISIIDCHFFISVIAMQNMKQMWSSWYSSIYSYPHHLTG